MCKKRLKKTPKQKTDKLIKAYTVVTIMSSVYELLELLGGKKK